MNDAVRTYKAAFKIPTKDTSVPFEIEEFIDWVVHKEPSKTQLHFCLGLINIRLKEDMRRTKQDFKMFLESTRLKTNFLSSENLPKNIFPNVMIGFSKLNNNSHNERYLSLCELS